MEFFDNLKFFLSELRYFTLFRHRYKVAQGSGDKYWSSEMRRYGNMEKRIQCSAFRWYIIEFKDGRKELAYLRVLQGGLLSGHSPAIYRGCIIPHMIGFITFSNIERIRLAF